jgi:hypothetical protein
MSGHTDLNDVMYKYLYPASVQAAQKHKSTVFLYSAVQYCTVQYSRVSSDWQVMYFIRSGPYCFGIQSYSTEDCFLF